MDNIIKLQDTIKSYLETKLSSKYDFELWKNTLIHTRNNDKKAALKEWGFFSDKFSVTNLIPDIQASNDDWDPCLHIDFSWKTKDAAINIRVILVKGEVRIVQIVDMFSLMKAYGENHDFAKEFESKVVMMDAIKGS